MLEQVAPERGSYATSDCYASARAVRQDRINKTGPGRAGPVWRTSPSPSGSSPRGACVPLSWNSCYMTGSVTLRRKRNAKSHLMESPESGSSASR
ncbi:hypothetical protein L596_020448 [Steinernema carpocapsae]|uniref:Uncharacterized protein n=1 Tax=Steinernema carpocapsae TaxID=34508 RepID=A0A4U5MTJ8_STECR|nr:hypothetical protein L596_020448 [Steinernema carpocapsae]